MSSALVSGSAWLLEQYVEGRLPMPGPVLDALLKAGIEGFYRFSPTLRELPPEWNGASGPIAEQSKELMQVHYDQPLLLFENFLGPTMKYTMALYERGARSLEEAQAAMMDDLCDKAGIRDGDTVLDIGCGFGSVSAHILQRFKSTKVLALNLSQTQLDYITAKQAQPGHPLHTDRFRIVKGDFAQFQYDRKFDRILVIGLFEHVRNIRAALQKIAGFLAPEGTVLIHFIAYRRLITVLADAAQELFFSKHVFPGGRFWYFNELPRYQEHLRLVDSWFLDGTNYQRTLHAWRRNFWQNIETIRTHPAVDERFLRIWDLYLRFCMAIFGGMGGRLVGNGQYLLRHARAQA